MPSCELSKSELHVPAFTAKITLHLQSAEAKFRLCHCDFAASELLVKAETEKQIFPRCRGKLRSIYRHK